VNAPWRRSALTLETVPPPVVDNRATAQLKLLTDLITEFLPRPEAARTPQERLRLQMLIATVQPMLSTINQGWDDVKAEATAAIIRGIAARQADLDRTWSVPALPAAVSVDEKTVARPT
jgi:hypothetical protein